MVKVDEPSYDSKEYLFYTGRQTFKSPEQQLPDDYSRKCWFGKLQQYFCQNLSIFYYPLYKDNPRVEENWKILSNFNALLKQSALS